jgi:hypothetical protein
MPDKERISGGWVAFKNRARIYDIALLPGETYEQFEELLKDHYEEFMPDGTTEEHKVRHLATLRWERDRLDRSQQLSMLLRQHELISAYPFLQDLRKLTARASEFQKAKSAEDVERLLSELHSVLADGIRVTCQLDNYEPERWGNVIAEALTTLDIEEIDRVSLLLKLQADFPVLDRVLKLDRIDILIDRTIKSLMQLKAVKQMYRQLEPKMIPTTKLKVVS